MELKLPTWKEFYIEVPFGIEKVKFNDIIFNFQGGYTLSITDSEGEIRTFNANTLPRCYKDAANYSKHNELALQSIDLYKPFSKIFGSENHGYCNIRKVYFIDSDGVQDCPIDETIFKAHYDDTGRFKVNATHDYYTDIETLWKYNDYIEKTDDKEIKHLSPKTLMEFTDRQLAVLEEIEKSIRKAKALGLAFSIQPDNMKIKAYNVENLDNYYVEYACEEDEAIRSLFCFGKNVFDVDIYDNESDSALLGNFKNNTKELK